MRYVHSVILAVALLVCIGVGLFTIVRTYGLYKQQTWGECSSAYLAKELALKVRGLVMSLRIDLPGDDLKSIDHITLYRAPAGTPLPETGLVLKRLPNDYPYSFSDGTVTVDISGFYAHEPFFYGEELSHVLTEEFPEILWVRIPNKPVEGLSMTWQTICLDETGPATKTFTIGPSDAVQYAEGEAFSKIPMMEAVYRSYVNRNLIENMIVMSALLIALTASTCYILRGLIHRKVE